VRLRQLVVNADIQQLMIEIVRSEMPISRRVPPRIRKNLWFSRHFRPKFGLNMLETSAAGTEIAAPWGTAAFSGMIPVKSGHRRGYFHP
jgi:hypothetical protein